MDGHASLNAGDRGSEDDAAVLVLLHVMGGALGEQKRRFQVGALHGVPIGGGPLVEGHAVVHPGIGDQDIEPAVFGRNGIDCLAAGIGIGHVEHGDIGFAALGFER
jgi:hypothetical protein